MRVRIALLSLVAVVLTACSQDGGGELLSISSPTSTSAVATTSVATSTDPSTTAPGTSTTAASTTSTIAPTEEEVADDQEKAEEDLTVNPGDIILSQLPEKARCDADDSAIIIPVEVREGDYDYRQFTDAVELPFKNGLSVESNLDEVFRTNCRNPVFLDMNIQGISTIELPWGYRPVQHMSWMGDWLGKAEAKPLTQFLVKRNGVLYPSAEMRERAEYVNAIILQGSASIDPDGQSVENWHLPVMEPGVLNRTVKNGAQEALPNVRLTFTYKAIGCVKSIGWNLLDKRFEIFSDCQQEPTPPTTTPPPSTPPTTVVVTTTTEKGKDHTVSPSTTLVVTCPEGYHLPRDGKTVEDCVKNAPPPSTTTTTTTVRVTPTMPPATTSPPAPTTTVDSGDGQEGEDA